MLDGGAVVTGTNSRGALLGRAAGPGQVRVELGDYHSTAADARTAHVRLDTGVNRYRAVGSRFAGGRLVLTPAGFGTPSTLLHTRCVEEGVERELPADSPRVATGDNLVH